MYIVEVTKNLLIHKNIFSLEYANCIKTDKVEKQT